MARYDFNSIEKKWRKRWEEHPVQTGTENKPKYYCLDMFPYPSGIGLHVGHWRGYTLSDVLSRFKILQGYHVLHPMGWDAFGLPAENFAINEGVHPSVSTAENVANMKRQLKEISAVYDWSKELNTTDPAYYKWTQWIFARMFEKGLAYEKEMPLNWCPRCKVVLANEEAANGECERCHSPVTKKNLRQWMLRITDYAERLLDDLKTLDWPEKVLKMQADWIGKSHGAEVDFAVEGLDEKIRVYTTRPDTLFGATFMVLAPEHSLVKKLAAPEQTAEVDAYVHRASTRSSVDRMADKEKTGVFTGRYAVNPMNGEKMPVWLSDYVLADYGTGAIMCVPAHDTRDFAFAKKFGLPIVQVIAPEGQAEAELEDAWTGDGVLVNSGAFNGLPVEKAKDAVAKYLDEKGIGKTTVNYKLRDWVFSRQRYWGEPIPIIHCPTCGKVVVPDKDLPVLLPEIKSYLPTDTGESPLSLIESWVNTACPKCGAAAKRETNTMPQWAGSSWYFLRYPDVNNSEALASPEVLKEWLPVDYYVGGVEHAVLHLLYARFYTKFLYDIGAVDFIEPFKKLFNQGMVNKDGKKMSKSAGNGVSPDEVIPKYGCDSLRLYELFVGPPEIDCEWIDSGIEGVSRFLNKVWRLAENCKPGMKPTAEMTRIRHKLAYDITSRLENLTLNTVVSGFMENTNALAEAARTAGGIDAETMETLTVLLAPFAPHISEELWERAGHKESVFTQNWPVYDMEKIKSNIIEIALQVNGKFRGNFQTEADTDKAAVLERAKAALGDKLSGAEMVKEIYVPGKIVNFVVKQNSR